VFEDLDAGSRIDWASRNLPLTRWACESLPSLAGMRLAATVHLDIKFAVAALEMQRRGAQLFLAAASRHATRQALDWDSCAASATSRGRR
jgi:S-adenosylhomocysteine hydrolase